MLLLWVACVLAGVVGLGIILAKRRTKDYKLPFVPFVLVAAIILLIAGGGEFS